VPDDRFAEFYRVNFKAVARINGIEIPISYFEVMYNGDRIPIAYIEIPIGTNAATGERSPAEGLFSKNSEWQLKPFSTMEIWVETRFEDGRAAPPDSPAGLIDGKTRIFDGYTQMPSYECMNTIAGGRQGLSLSGFGKLGGLTAGTQLVKGTIVPEPNAGVGLVTAQAGASGNIVSSLKDSLLKYPIERQIWGQGLKILMQSSLNTLAAFDDFSDANEFASIAFKRINANNVVPEALLDLTPLTGTDVDAGSFRTALSGAMADTFYNSWAANARTATLFDALINVAGLFYFHVIPVVEEEGLMPLCFNAGVEPWREIMPSDYYMWKRETDPDVGLYTYVTRVALQSDKFATSEFQNKTAKTTALGTAEISKDLLGNEGMAMGQLRMVEAPTWAIPTESSGANSLRPGFSIPDSANPNADGGTDKHGDHEQALLSCPLGKGLAKLALHDNLFTHRRATLAGRFRLDIAPGSTLKIVVPGTTNQTDVVYAMARRVTLKGGTRGQDSFASTSFKLIAVRSEREYETISVADVPTHPLYIQIAFRGCPLVALE
jgi:hypothetical protein